MGPKAFAKLWVQSEILSGKCPDSMDILTATTSTLCYIDIERLEKGRLASCITSIQTEKGAG